MTRMPDNAPDRPSLATYRNDRAYPFCPGCGHISILDRLDQALAQLAFAPNEVVLVSDIGCAGLSDQYFATSAFHGLHGRSITYATGIKLVRPSLHVIVLMGDGGAGIGGAHLLSAARRNIGITVLVMNNMNFGMTGGQHSVTTPGGAITSTTPGGNLERPLDICATVGVNGAGYVYRGTNFDDDLADRIAAGIAWDGFALLDIWDLCTAYYVPSNKMSKKALRTTLAGLELEAGLLHERQAPEYAAAYRRAAGPPSERKSLVPKGLEPRFAAGLERRFHLVVAGSAGGKVRSAVRTVARAGILSGLWAAQRDDYPVTVKAGHSVSELILGPDPIEYTGGDKPDAVLVLSRDGLGKVHHYLDRMGPGDRVFVVPEFADIATAAAVTVIDPRSGDTRIPNTQVALSTVGAMMKLLGCIPEPALEEAVTLRQSKYARSNLMALRAGFRL